MASRCSFVLPPIPWPSLGLGLPSLILSLSLGLSIPGFRLNLLIPFFGIALSLSFPSVSLSFTFGVSIPGFSLRLKLPPIPFPSLGLELPEFPALPDFTVACPLD